jgi:tetratricopeptide (TPR) repeat protein
MGEFVAARAGSEEALMLYDSADLDTAFSERQWTNDVRIAVLSVSIESLTYLGHLDQARLRRDEAIVRARRIKHAGSLAYILSCIVGCEANTETDPAIRLHHILELETFCNERGFALWERSAKWQHACCLMALGRTVEATELQAEAGVELLNTASFLHKPTWYMALADSLGKAGRAEDGLKELEHAVRQIEATEERWAEADLYRIRGELLVLLDRAAEAEPSFRRAIEIARGQSAKLWEIRAATSLARLWSTRGKHKQAFDLLVPICNWFTEGLDTPVLREARVTLEKLAA